MLFAKHFRGGRILTRCSFPSRSHPSHGLLSPLTSHSSPAASLHQPSFSPGCFASAVTPLPGGFPAIHASSALSWIIIPYEMSVLYPPPVLKCQEYIPRPSIFSTSAWAWQFSDMNIMALNAETPSLKLTSVRISSLEQGKGPFHMQRRVPVTLHLVRRNQGAPAIP